MQEYKSRGPTRGWIRGFADVRLLLCHGVLTRVQGRPSSFNANLASANVCRRQRLGGSVGELPIQGRLSAKFRSPAQLEH